MAALSYAVTASVCGSATPDIHSLLEQRIMRSLGIPDSAWSIGYGRAPLANIVRQAIGSDNWPITWAPTTRNMRHTAMGTASNPTWTKN